MPAARWLTFDCYGTIADWNACMLGALQPIAGGHSPSLLAAYHRAESILEARTEWRPYREILTDGLGMAARRPRTGFTSPTAGCTTSCPPPGWGCARCGWTVTIPGTPPSSRSGASPA